MILLDTDHLSVLETPPSDRRNRLVARLALVGDEVVGTTIVNIEEQMRGWLASIAKERVLRRQTRSYQRLHRFFQFYQAFYLAQLDDAAVNLLETWGQFQVGMMDKKIAAITIVINTLLLTANRRDYSQFPGLHFDNWMD